MRGRRGPAGRTRRAGGLAFALACVVALAASSAAQDVGFSGPSFAGASAGPTRSKPESKLWHRAGEWWGVLWSTTGDAFHVHRLDQRTHLWTDTGVLVDARGSSKADALAIGDVLWVGSHRFVAGTGSSGNPILLLRYRYDAGQDRYVADPGFPVTIGSYSTESLTIARDSTGTLWAAWVQARRIYVAHSVGGDDRAWVAPYVLPGSDVDLDSDEVCALTHFGGGAIGVLWSDQKRDRFLFAVHQDGAPDGAWSLETPLAGESDDHINLATDAAGRVFAAVKNEADEIKLLVRSPAGAWSSHLVSTGIERFTRPIVLLDETARRVHVYGCGQDDGVIHRKSSSLDTIAFASGTGTVVLRDVSDPLLVDVTSTKQNVDGTSGLVVLASHETTDLYWHNGVPPDDLLVAAFEVDVVSGQAPLAVAFTDLSTGPPTGWTWDFGDGAMSAEQHPVHVYSVPGTYDVTLTVTDALGADSETRSALVAVRRALPTRTYAPVADARVERGSAGTNFGTAAALSVRLDGSRSSESYLRFDLSDLAGPVVSARLRLWCTDGSTRGALVHRTSNAWSEGTVNWNNRPQASGPQVAALGSLTPFTWVEIDVTSAVTGPGPLDLLLTSDVSNAAAYSSREGVHPPELVVETDAVGPPAADFSAAPTDGAAPLAVTFTDLSTGGPTAWSWDFGDGAGSSERHPVHVYTSPGTYTVALTATNALGSSVRERIAYVSVVPPGAPVAAFTASPTSGPAPLAVTFGDLSSGDVTAWWWDFGDGATSTVQHPVHVYAAPGTYTVSLTASGPGGADAETKTDLVTVTDAPPVQVLLAAADARVNQGSASSNAGSATDLRVRLDASNAYESYLRFDVPELGAVTSARLRLWCTDGSPVGGLVFPTSSAWGESTLTWANRPAASGPEIASLGVVAAGAWVEADVTAAVSGGGPVSFLLRSTSSNSALYSSREGTRPPELVVEAGSGGPPGPPVAAFSASPTSGPAPLAVTFGDLSSGSVTGWSWDFGDGAGSSAQHPAHVYTAPGTYTVSLTVSGPGGSDVETKTDLVTVSDAPPVQVLVAAADARVNQGSPGSNAGAATELRVRLDTSGAYESYLRFDVPELGAITSARLRLWCTDASPVGGLVYPTSSAWSETTLTWANRPAASGPEIASLGVVAAGAWVEVDVTPAVTGGGPASFLLRSTSSNSALYSSREGTHPPELVVEAGGTGTSLHTSRPLRDRAGARPGESDSPARAPRP